MLDTLRSLVGKSHGSEVVLECRDCGTDIDSGHACPSCGSEDIARYEID